MKLGDIIKVEVSNISISITEDCPKKVSGRELAGLQYIGRYILHNLHNNFRNHKKWRDIELQQATSLSRACSTTKPCGNQKLNSLMSRGGLSFIKPQFQKILVIAERYFCHKTQVSYLCEIDLKKISYDLVYFRYIKDYFSEIVEESELKPYDIVSDGVLHGIIELYIKIRSFSTAADYVHNDTVV